MTRAEGVVAFLLFLVLGVSLMFAAVALIGGAP